MAKIKLLTIFLAIPILLVLVTACGPDTVYMYQCKDGSFNRDYSVCERFKCPTQECPTCEEVTTKTVEVLRYQCANGSYVKSVSQCAPIKPCEETPIENIVGDYEGLSDFSVYGDLYCHPDTTELQKKAVFDEFYKDKYVEWSGIVGHITESQGNYELGVKLCDSTWTWDLEVIMKDNQKNMLLQLLEGDRVTFRARMSSIGNFLTDLKAYDGEIVP